MLFLMRGKILSEQTNKALKDINQKIIKTGEELPEVILKDGSKVQTGTVATMLYNIDLYNKLPSDSAEREKIQYELVQAVPTLIKVGLFALFSPEEWISGNNAGRRVVGIEAKKLLS